MNPMLKKIILYVPITLMGLWGMFLQDLILRMGFDEKGLLIGNNPELLLLWALTGCFLAGALVFVLTLGRSGTYEENFPRCIVSGIVMIVSGVLLSLHGVNMMVPGKILDAGLAIAAGVAMVYLGICRIAGIRCMVGGDLLVTVFYAVYLLHSYSGWNADPQLQRYAYPLLAGVSAMLFTMHRGRCAVGVAERKRMVFTGLCGIFFSFLAIPGSQSLPLFLATGLWCAGAMGDLRRLKPLGGKRLEKRGKKEGQRREDSHLRSEPDDPSGAGGI